MIITADAEVAAAAAAGAMVRRTVRITEAEVEAVARTTATATIAETEEVAPVEDIASRMRKAGIVAVHPSEILTSKVTVMSGLI